MKRAGVSLSEASFGERRPPRLTSLAERLDRERVALLREHASWVRALVLTETAQRIRGATVSKGASCPVEQGDFIAHGVDRRTLHRARRKGSTRTRRWVVRADGLAGRGVGHRRVRRRFGVGRSLDA
jgi:hypothetical protein